MEFFLRVRLEAFFNRFVGEFFVRQGENLKTVICLPQKFSPQHNEKYATKMLKGGGRRAL